MKEKREKEIEERLRVLVFKMNDLHVPYSLKNYDAKRLLANNREGFRLLMEYRRLKKELGEEVSEEC